MKNIRNRALALVLALVLLTGLLSGCGQEEDPIQEFGGLVMEELFRMLPCEKVLLHRQ